MSGLPAESVGKRLIEALDYNNTSPIDLDRKIYCNDKTIEQHPYDSDLDFSRIQTCQKPTLSTVIQI
jgi:hypothetical protein